ncbi:MAG: hypothetical protein GX631_00685 [Dehalococcoidales bacterium]|nr:hypothetical protein [Dehalococcoidales bacterium]
MEERENIKETRQERRERKLIGKKQQVKKHNQGFARLYKEAISKRINKLRKDKSKRQKAAG